MKARLIGKASLTALCFLLILIPRIKSLGLVATTDEPVWLHRSHVFSKAVANVRFEETFRTSHPGVTLMWIGDIAVLVDKLLIRINRYATPTSKTGEPAWGMESQGREYGAYYLKLEQSGVAIVTSFILFLACFWFAQTLSSYWFLVISSIMVAFDPFLVGLCRIVHLDGLLAAFCIASCAALSRHFSYSRKAAKDNIGSRATWIFVSGALAGLALLTKSAALVLLPWTLLAFVAYAWFGYRGPYMQKIVRFKRSLRQGIADWLLWLTPIPIIAMLIWPAVWVDGVDVLRSLIKGVLWACKTPHVAGAAELSVINLIKNYIIRIPIFIAPWLPWVAAVAMVALLLSRLKQFRHPEDKAGSSPCSLPARQNWLVVALLLGSLALLFPFCLGCAQKQAARYILTTFVAIDFLVAMLIIWALLNLNLNVQARFITLVCLSMFLLLIGWKTVAWWTPYLTAYRNPYWGDLHVNGKPLVRGWSEGVGEATRRLNRIKGSETFILSSRNPGVVRLFAKGRAKTYSRVKDGTADFIFLERNFAETYAHSIFVRKLKSVYPLHDTIYLPQVRGHPDVWVFCGLNSKKCPVINGNDAVAH